MYLTQVYITTEVHWRFSQTLVNLLSKTVFWAQFRLARHCLLVPAVIKLHSLLLSWVVRLSVWTRKWRKRGLKSHAKSIPRVGKLTTTQHWVLKESERNGKQWDWTFNRIFTEHIHHVILHWITSLKWNKKNGENNWTAKSCMHAVGTTMIKMIQREI